MSLETLIEQWKHDADTADNIAVWRTTPARVADTRPFPADLPAVLRKALEEQGIRQLYSHQHEAWLHAAGRRNVVLSTGTASGKTLAYNLPVLAALIADPIARALYMFPTKALAQDQLNQLNRILIAIHRAGGPRIEAAIYDGDTPQAMRPGLRTSARIIITNPDMLHTGILPHHTSWMDLFSHLRYAVLDEMHTYRGVFGSHVANVLRRLRRVAHHYGSDPQFIASSATIGNPRVLAQALMDVPVELVDVDGSLRGPRHLLFYNPPVVNPSLGLRKSAVTEAVRLTQDAFRAQVQTVVFSRTRRTVEMLLSYLQGGAGGTIRGYRSGYLPGQRREIEQGLRDGSVRTVVATTALELGIDIGGLGAAVLVGYPGTIASVYQQSGRAGRGEAPALSILVASPSPLDQYLVHHPDYFFGRSPERALVNPDHLLILLGHLRCAMFELPFEEGQSFGSLPADKLKEFLDFLVANNEAHESKQKVFWMSDAYPAAKLSLRSASAETVVLSSEDGERPTVIGEVDGASALWMVHPKAVYLHEGQQFFVQALDLEKHIATLVPVGLDYYTEPIRDTRIQVLAESDHGTVQSADKTWGEIKVTTTVTSFKKLRWLTNENLGVEPLDLPPTEVQTTGYWFSLTEAAVGSLRASGAWTNDPNDYGADWAMITAAVRKRDGYRCQVCGAPESGRPHDVHHRRPFRSFATTAEANRLDNLITLCREDHRNAEQNVRFRSGMAGLGYVLGQIAPLTLMCDPGDLGVHIDEGDISPGRPSLVIYDQVPAGIGFSEALFREHEALVRRALELVGECPCADGCPSCVGPGGENGAGAKASTLQILRALTTS